MKYDLPKFRRLQRQAEMLHAGAIALSEQMTEARERVAAIDLEISDHAGNRASHRVVNVEDLGDGRRQRTVTHAGEGTGKTVVEQLTKLRDERRGELDEIRAQYDEAAQRALQARSLVANLSEFLTSHGVKLGGRHSGVTVKSHG